MLVERLLVTIVLLPLGLLLIAGGGWLFALVIAIILALAGWEYVKLMRLSGHQPAEVIVIGGAAALALGRAWDGFESAGWLLSLLVLGAMTWHLLAYERGRDSAPVDFGVTLGGVFYLGWIGAYLISLRDLPEGKWWFLLALPAVWLADSGAYMIGSRFGRRKLSPRLSPKKTWEGYWGGLITGALGAALLALVWRIGAGPESGITAWRAALLGLVISAAAPLGDLGESMFKRMAGIKDSSNLIPGHGGVFDRIDSWLWAGVIGYYLAAFLSR